MQEVDGVKVASPSHDHQVTSIDDMDADAFYPTACFNTYLLPRGRMLSQALGQDHAAPEPVKVKNAKCYTRAQIQSYLEGYGDSFLDLSAAVQSRVNAIRLQDEIQIAKRMDQMEEQSALLDAEKEKMHASYQERIEEFSRRFIAQYARDITSGTNSICGVYFLRLGKEIVYIGQSVNVYARIAQHRRDKVFDGVDFLPCESERLDELEGFFIRLLRPALNGHDEGRKSGAPKSSLWGQVVSLDVGAKGV